MWYTGIKGIIVPAPADHAVGAGAAGKGKLIEIRPHTRFAYFLYGDRIDAIGYCAFQYKTIRKDAVEVVFQSKQ